MCSVHGLVNSVTPCTVGCKRQKTFRHAVLNTCNLTPYGATYTATITLLHKGKVYFTMTAMNYRGRACNKYNRKMLKEVEIRAKCKIEYFFS